MVDLAIFGMDGLELHAAHLDAFCVADAAATIKYDILAGALVWSDETDASTPSAVIDGLRQLRHYRTHVMLHGIEPDNDVWRHCQSLFPNWVGFLPERHTPTPALLAIYRRGEVSARWCLRQLERDS